MVLLARLPDLGATKKEKERWRHDNKCFRGSPENNLANDCHTSTQIRSLKRAREPKQPRESKNKDKGRVRSQTNAFRARITSLEKK